MIDFLVQYIAADHAGHVLAIIVVAGVLGVAHFRHRLAPKKESSDA